MKTLIATSLVALAGLTLASTHVSRTPEPARSAWAGGAAGANAQDYGALKEQAERFFAEGSYGRARELYERADGLALEPAEARWVDFRLADTLWRSAAATDDPDDTELQEARETLERLVRDIERQEERDRVWLEVQESLGDWWWTRRNSRNWSQAWNHYSLAFEAWASSSELELARERYLGLLWRILDAQETDHRFHSWIPGLPLDVVDGAIELAREPSERARAHFTAARLLRQSSWSVVQQRRLLRELEAALEGGAENAWYDDALFAYAQHLAGTGRVVVQPDGGVRYEPDYVAAVELYRRLVREFAPGESAWRDDAERQIEAITSPSLGLSVSNVFLPGSKVQVQLSWRNLGSVELALAPVDLTRDVQLREREQNTGDWLASIDLAAKERLRSWREAVVDRGDHAPGSRTLVLEGELAPGAYVLAATGGGQSARELVLVTEQSLVLQTLDDTALAWVTRALDGRPVAGARVRLWSRSYDGRNWIWRDYEAETGEDGLARIALRASERSRNLFAASRAGAHQAFGLAGSGRQRSERDAWRIYALTDRPAYRPEDTAHWKLVARRGEEGAWALPAGATLGYRITDPRGAEVASGEVELNAFGSASGELAMQPAWPLGEYRVSFRDAGSNVGSATLFRLEEYKLPEFAVSVSTPEANGKKLAFKSGERVSVEITAEYYFGGPVAGAELQALVYRDPWWPRWTREREYPWYYEQPPGYRPWYGGSQLVSQQTLETDAEGKATLAFDTDVDAGADFEYRVVARVTDASRREVSGAGSVRVTRQRYYVQAEARHNLHRPQDEVAIDFEAQDANGEPYRAEGLCTVSRARTVELWIGPGGRRLSGEAYRRERRPGEDWRLERRTEEHDEILSRLLSTDAEGRVSLVFTPERTGVYRVQWTSRDDDGIPITAALSVYVADDSATELGVRHGALDIVLDKDTFRAGETAAVMLMAPSSDRWVLFTVHGGELFDARVVHLEGSVKLLSLPLDRRHVPNVFLSAHMVGDGALWSDAEEVVVPPVEQFLTVEVEPDAAVARPGSEGTLTVTTRDHAGEPVAAEVALALVDESVFAIQESYAGDPRQFFYGDKRRNRVRVQSSFQQRAYARLAEDGAGQLVDERQVRLDRNESGAWAEEERLRAGQRELAADDFALGMAAKSSGGPSAPAARAPASSMERAQEGGAYRGAGDTVPPGGAGQGEPAVVVRSDFRTTALWEPALVTGPDGTARVTVRYPDSTTRWRASARASDAGTRFGEGRASARTRLPLQVRLQGPRFFVAGDACTLSALIDNNTDAPLTVAPSLVSEGGVRLAEEPGEGTLTVPAGGQARADWAVLAEHAGPAKLRVQVRGAELADAMERTFTVYEHGIDKLVAKSAKMTAEELRLLLQLPAARRAGSTAMTVQVAPSLAVALLDALPYLIDYPYGCTEQTMSRFLPAVITARTLASLGLEPADVAGRLFGGIEAEHAGDTHAKKPRELARMDEMIAASLERLLDFQHTDGGWGWWKTGDSDALMSAYVLWGLALARDAEIDVPENALERAAQWLTLELVEAERRPDLQAWMLHALSVHRKLAGRAPDGALTARALDNLWGRRDQLNAYTRALFALAAWNFGDWERARILVRNLENGVAIDETPDTSIVQRGAQASDPAAQRTAHWGNDGVIWRWSEGSVEATAFCLRALVTIDPDHALVPAVSHWLVRNRRGAQWSNTRDTAIAILALNDYLRASGELATELDYELWVNGKSLAVQSVRPADVIAAPSRFAVPAELLRDGENEVRLVRTRGSGPLYVSAEARFFSLEEPVTPAGNELFVRREYNRMVAVPTLLKGPRLEPRPWVEGEPVPSGERIEVVLTIEAKNDCEYLVFEDLKPAGLEAVSLVSGEPLALRELKSGALERSLLRGGRTNEAGDYTGRARSVHQELRDRKVALFVDKLPQGTWELRYELRAEVPGRFHALPVLGHAMYVPEIRCNGAEVRFHVAE